MEKLVPKLRFSGFEGEWVISELSKFCEVNPKSNELPEKFIYIDLESVEKGQLVKLNIVYRKEAPSRAKRTLSPGDVLYQTVRPYQRNNYYFEDTIADYVASTGYAQLRVSKNNSKFLFQILHDERFVDRVILRCTGTSYPAINSTDLGQIEINFPSLPEQTKIAEFLTAIDKRIELLTAKKEKLTLYKKGVMQKIFNQELRFTDENGEAFPEWEEKKLGEIGSIVKLKNKDNEITQVFTNSAKYGVVQQEDFFDREITTKVNLKNYYIIDNGQFVYNPRISNLAPVGPIGMNKMGKGLLSPLYTIFSISVGHLAFFEQYFRSTLWHQYIRDNGNSGARSDRMSVTVGVLMNLPLNIPTIAEQTKIACFLNTFDLEIQKVDQQITLNQTYKKGLLQQMFV